MIPASADPILVVGAGPAGATAARTLAAAGVPVRILDRASFPRNKPCGGGISLRVLKRFPYLEDALPRIATHTLKRLYLEGPGGESTVIESDEPAALMIRRLEFDDLLLSLALREGGELCVCDLAWVLERAQNLVSHHLRALRSGGLVDYRREGKMALYSLSERGQALLELVGAETVAARG